MNNKAMAALAAAVMAIHVGLLAWSSWIHAPVYDEPGHLVAGLRILSTGEFGVYRVNPPLVKVLAAWPVLLARPTLDWTHCQIGPGARPEFVLGMDFIAVNGARSFLYITLARLSCIPLSVLGGTICYLWAGRLYGKRSGLFALILWCTCPNIIAWGSAITPDVGAASLGIAAAYAFWRWLDAADWPHAIWCGLSFGLAVLAKSSWIVLFALWPMLWCLRRRLPGRTESGRPRPRAQQLAGAMALALAIINLGYCFEDTFRPLKDFTFVSRALAGADSQVERGVGGNRFAGTMIGNLPVPLPANFVLGIDMQKCDFEMGLDSYLDGQWSDKGWVHYYVISALYKIPAGTWLLLGLVLAHRAIGLARAGEAGPWPDEAILLAPALLMFGLISSQDGISRHFRYALPCLPALFIFAGQSGALVSLACPLRSACILGSIAWASASSLAAYPHSLSYFSELAGGPNNGHRHLLDSNIDWGQDLLLLKGWYDEHPEARPLAAALHGHHFDVNEAGVEFTTPPPGPDDSPAPPSPDRERDFGPRPGWYAMSVHRLHDRDGKYDYFLLHFTPKFKIGYSIYIYEITGEEADAVREKMGLRKL